MTITVVIYVTGGLDRFSAKCHGIRWLSVFRFGRRFGCLLVLEVLLRDRSATTCAINHLVSPCTEHIGSRRKPLEIIFAAQQFG